jgi:hypothetical protein
MHRFIVSEDSIHLPRWNMKALIVTGILISIAGALLFAGGSLLTNNGHSEMDSANKHKIVIPGGEKIFPDDKYQRQYDHGVDTVSQGENLKSMAIPLVLLSVTFELAGIGVSVRESMGVKKP